MRELMGHRDARLAISGQVLSGLGDSALWIAMAVWIKTITGSSSLAGLSFFMFIGGSLLSPLGGIVLDRCRRRPVLIVLNAAGVALISPLLLVHGRGGLPVMYAVMFGYGVLNGLINGAQAALVQAVVPGGLLGGANGLVQTLNQVMRLVSPLLGAGAYTALGAAPVVVADMATFALCAVLVAMISLREAPAGRSAEPLGRQMTAGLRHITGDAVLRRLTFATGLAIVAFGLSETVDFQVVAEGLHRSPGFFGVLSACSGVGGTAGGLISPRLLRRFGGGRLMAAGLAAAGVGFALLTAPSAPVVLAGTAVVGCGIPWVLVALMTALQQLTPAGLMGRVNTAAGIVISGPQTLAVAAGAWLVAVVDYRVLLLVMTATLLAAAVYARGGPVPPAPADGAPAVDAVAAVGPAAVPEVPAGAAAPAAAPGGGAACPGGAGESGSP